MLKHRFLYFNQFDQKISFPSKEIEKPKKSQRKLGKMTRAEFDMLLEILSERFDEKNITQLQFARYFNEVRQFTSRLKRTAL